MPTAEELGLRAGDLVMLGMQRGVERKNYDRFGIFYTVGDIRPDMDRGAPVKVLEIGSSGGSMVKYLADSNFILQTHDGRIIEQPDRERGYKGWIAREYRGFIGPVLSRKQDVPQTLV